MIDKVFQALSSNVRRKILACLSEGGMTAGELARHFDITKPSLSKHLSILENAGLVVSEKKGQFVHYALAKNNLINTVNSYMQQICPATYAIKKELKKKKR